MMHKQLFKTLSYHGAFHFLGYAPDGDEIEIVGKVETDENAWIELTVEQPCTISLHITELEGMAEALRGVTKAENLAEPE